MTDEQPQPIAYILKKYPRLSETFILNEMRALERLGTRLQVFSLLRTEGSIAHPTVAEVLAPVTYFPERLWTRVAAVAKAHMTIAMTAPARYFHAAGLALLWSARSRRPLSVWKNFARSAYVAIGCRQHRVRHIHAHFANAPATVARLVSVMCDVPYSFTTHAKDLYLTPQKVMRRRIGSARFVLTCTHYNLDYLRSFTPAQDWAKLRLVYHGIDLAEFQLEPGAINGASGNGKADDAAPLILSVGRLVVKKGMADLISACRMLRARGVRFRCIIVGEGPLRAELDSQIREFGLESLVTLAGAMAHDRLISLYGRASVFTLVPHITQDGDRDGIPNVLGEAMAARIPVVSTSISGIPELIEDGRTGLLVAPKAPSALADSLEHLLREPWLRQKLVVAARRKIEDGFQCWETAKALRTLLAEGHS